MIIGVPRERKTLEKRVAVTPDGAAELIKHGHTVRVETGAGIGSGFSDDQFRHSGATIVATLSEVWGAELVTKVKEPHPSEYPLFRPGMMLFDFLHLAGIPEVAHALIKGGVTGIAFELVTTEDRRLPILEPMSEVAGKLAVVNGATHLLSQHGGRGVLLGGTLGVLPARVAVVGAGVAGKASIEMAVGAGADVTVLDRDVTKLDRIKLQFGSRVKTLHSTRASIERTLAETDLLIGAVLVPGAAAPKVITREMIRRMPQGAVFVDISIDQGGCAETSRPTSLDAPTFTEEGVIHYGVTNMPAQVPRTSTMALTAATLPYLLALADFGLEGATKRSPALAAAVSTYRGKITNAPSAESLGLPFDPFVKAAF